MCGDAGLAVFPECVELSCETGAVIDSFLGVLGVVGWDLEPAAAVLALRGVLEPLLPR